MVEVAATVAVNPQQEAVAGGLETCNHSNNVICLCLNPISIPNFPVIQPAPHMHTHREACSCTYTHMLTHTSTHAHTITNVHTHPFMLHT